MQEDFFSKEELFLLYEIEIKRENEIRSKWRSSLNIYVTTILSLLTGAVVYVMFINNYIYMKIFIIFVGFLIISISLIAYFHFKLDYKYQMEILSIQIKIEDMLGLSDSKKCCDKHRWKGEALLPKSYYENSKMAKTSDEFISKMCSIREINYYSLFYYVFVILGIIIVLIGLFYNGKML